MTSPAPSSSSAPSSPAPVGHTRTWRLAGQGFFAFVVANVLLIGGGALVASVTYPPMKYNEHNTLLVGLLISVGVVALGAGASGRIGDASHRLAL